MSILVVDDSLATRSVLQMILEDAGYQKILLMESAHEAFQCLGRVDSIARSARSGQVPGRGD